MTSCKHDHHMMSAKSNLRKRNPFLLSLVFYLFGTTVLPCADSYNILANESYIIQNPFAGSAQFFGYDFVWSLPKAGEPRGASFLVGTPKTVSTLQPSRRQDSSQTPNSPQFYQGELFDCEFSTATETSSCKSVRPPWEYPDDPTILTQRDSVGVTVWKTPGNSKRRDAVVCAPLRIRNCSSNYLTQGACFSSDNFGESWKPETRKVSYCPVRLIDLMFILDGSRSVNAKDPRNFGRVKDWVKRVSSTFDLMHFAHIGVVQYSHWYDGRSEQKYLKTEIKLGEYKNQADFKAAVDNIVFQGYTTFTAAAINKTVEDFMASERFNDTTTRKVMILLTDGRSNDFEKLPQSAEYARSMGIITFAVGVADYVKTELQIIASGQEGNNERVYGLQRFSDLQQIVVSLQKSISGILEVNELDGCEHKIQIQSGGLGGNRTNELDHSEVGIGGSISKVRVTCGLKGLTVSCGC